MLCSAVSVLVVAQPISEVAEGLMNYPVLFRIYYTRALLNSDEAFPATDPPQVSLPRNVFGSTPINFTITEFLKSP